MWYSYRESSKIYPLTIARVNEMLELNKQQKRADNLEQVQTVLKSPIDIEPVYEDLVGQATMSSLRKTADRKKQNNRKKSTGSGGGQRPNQPANRTEGTAPQTRTEGGGNTGGQPRNPNQQRNRPAGNRNPNQNRNRNNNNKNQPPKSEG